MRCWRIRRLIGLALGGIDFARAVTRLMMAPLGVSLANEQTQSGIDWYAAEASMDEEMPVHRLPGFSGVSAPIRVSRWRTLHHFQPKRAGIAIVREATVVCGAPKYEEPADPCARQVSVWSGKRQLAFAAALMSDRRTVKATQSGPPCQLKGATLVAGGFHQDCANYYHYWCDLIGDLWFAQQQGLDLTAVDHLLMPYAGLPWQQEILALCQIPLQKVRPFSSHAVFHAESLSVPSRIKGAYRHPRWLTDALTQMCQMPSSDHGMSWPEKLYITRKNATRRPLLNEQAVIDCVRARGFEVVDFASLSVVQQIQRMQHARVVVAPHGAGLTNLVWAKPGTCVLELISRAHPSPCFFRIAQQRGLRYHAIASNWHERIAHPIYAPWRVSVADVDRALAQLGDDGSH